MTIFSSTAGAAILTLFDAEVLEPAEDGLDILLYSLADIRERGTTSPKSARTERETEFCIAFTTESVYIFTHNISNIHEILDRREYYAG